MLSVLVFVWIGVGLLLFVSGTYDFVLTVHGHIHNRRAMKSLQQTLSGAMGQMHAEMAAKEAEGRARGAKP